MKTQKFFFSYKVYEMESGSVWNLSPSNDLKNSNSSFSQQIPIVSNFVALLHWQNVRNLNYLLETFCVIWQFRKCGICDISDLMSFKNKSLRNDKQSLSSSIVHLFNYSVLVLYQLSQNVLTTRQEQLNERLFTTTFRDMEMHPI